MNREQLKKCRQCMTGIHRYDGQIVIAWSVYNKNSFSEGETVLKAISKAIKDISKELGCPCSNKGHCCTEFHRR